MRVQRFTFAGVEALEGRRMLAADLVVQWNNVLLDTIRTARTSPPYAARNMAIVQTAVYDAVKRLDGGRKTDRAASESAAAAQAAHDTLAALYPALKETFDAALTSSLASIPDGKAQDKGVAAGAHAAERELKKRASDGADAVVDYTPGTGPADWQPTPPG
ncbi:MAG TPA: hypothetical protein VH475_11995, partial [Tepidisphaeraceae bacterium]